MCPNHIHRLTLLSFHTAACSEQLYRHDVPIFERTTGFNSCVALLPVQLLLLPVLLAQGVAWRQEEAVGCSKIGGTCSSTGLCSRFRQSMQPNPHGRGQRLCLGSHCERQTEGVMTHDVLLLCTQVSEAWENWSSQIYWSCSPHCRRPKSVSPTCPLPEVGPCILRQTQSELYVYLSIYLSIQVHEERAQVHDLHPMSSLVPCPSTALRTNSRIR